VSIELSIIAPCLNEEANLAALQDRVFAAVDGANISAELILVDDGSTDATWDTIERLSETSSKRVRGVRHDKNQGIAAAWRSGVSEARGRYSCFIDADLQNPPEQVVTLYRRLLESRADIAQGTRSSIERLRDSRLTFSRGLNLLLNLVFRTWATDSKSGFVLAPTGVLADVVSYRGSYRYFQTFISVAAKAKGYSILEVETLFQSRYAGSSFLTARTLHVSLGALADFPRAIAEFGLRRHPHGASIGPRSEPPSHAAHPYRGWRKLLFEAYFATMPLHAWKIGHRTRDLYLELKQSEWFSRAELDDLQLRKLQRLVQHAYVHVPHYRDEMRKAGLDPANIKSLDDIRSLPLLAKADVRKGLYFDLFADNHDKRRMLRISTSGSTGEPFVTYADEYQLEFRFATTLRALEWTGWRFGDRQARLWHQTIGMSRLEIMRERIDAWFMRRLFVPAFEFTPEKLEEFVRGIREHRPVLVDGYAESLNFLAHFAAEGRDPGFSPKAIMSSAQSLTESSRDAIEAAFGARVFDKYGSREFSGIAYECGHGRDHHVMDESYLVELLVDGRPARPGETGEVVVTDLNNFSVPLIRYRIGDLAVAVDESVPCSCGRRLSRIGRIEGRTQAIVHCANGTWLPGTFFAHFFKDYEYAVRFFQIHQTEVGSMTLRLVKGSRFTDEALDELLDGLREFTGETMHIRIEFVDEIPLGVTGKRAPVVSDVELDFQEVTSRKR
jgi:phenylacetate-CoA ligase